MLSGQQPFHGEDTIELFEKIKRCEYDFNAPAWEHVSQEAQDLIRGLLVADPDTRLTGEQIMAHPWV